MSESFLATSDLCRYYQRGGYKVKAVDEVDIEVPQGEFLALVGASGSGKSTLLNLLAGLDTPTSGNIIFKGTNLQSLNRRELASYRAKKVGMVFQSFNLLPHYTALKNVELALYFNDTSRSERHDQAVEILTRLGLEDRLEHLPSDLSGGEQQRVALARALVKKPEVLFADEPTGNLDRDNSRQIAQLLKAQNDEGLTVVLVTHDQELAEASADRLIRLHYGQVVKEQDDSNDTGELS